jgi:hypothetical protein
MVQKHAFMYIKPESQCLDSAIERVLNQNEWYLLVRRNKGIQKADGCTFDIRVNCHFSRPNVTFHYFPPTDEHFWFPCTN